LDETYSEVPNKRAGLINKKALNSKILPVHFSSNVYVVPNKRAGIDWQILKMVNNHPRLLGTSEYRVDIPQCLGPPQ